jgi:pimeloyl-ACP methyl ester carboxylesterase
MSRKRILALVQAKAVGKQLGIKWDKFDLGQFRAGLGVELEHGTVNQTTNVTGDDPLLTGKIALAHLTEFPDYYNRPGAKVSQSMMDSFWLQGMQAGAKNTFDCIKAFSETDFTADLKKFDVPTLIIHGDDDQIVPIGAAALRSSKLVRNATLKIYAGAPHGLAATHRDQLNADLLEFIKI